MRPAPNGEEAGQGRNGPIRERILASAVDLGAQLGFANVSVAQIAAEAGVSEAGFGEHFASREECLCAVCDAACARAADRAAAAMQASRAGARENADGTFEAGLAELLECAAAAPELASWCLEGVSVLGPAGLRCRAAALTQFMRVLEEQLGASGGAGAPPIAVEMIVGGVAEVVRRALSAGDAAGLPALAPGLAALWAPLLDA